MIRIIKPGKIEKITKEFKCYHCLCEFEADENSFEEKYEQDGIYFSHYICCDCPTCGNRCYAGADILRK